MAKQKSTGNNVGHKAAQAPSIVVDDTRKQLLAHMASRIVPCVMQDPGPTTTSPEAIAEVAVDIAEAILQKVGL